MPHGIHTVDSDSPKGLGFQPVNLMTLANDQSFIYAWRYKDDPVCKLGVSTTRRFYTHVKAAKSVTWQEIELLGIQLHDTPEAAKEACTQLLKQFERMPAKRAWVHLNDAVWTWLRNACLSNPPSLETFKEVFQNDSEHRQREREYQRKHAKKRKASRSRRTKPGKKPTEQQKAYNREYARKQRQNNPEHKERQKASLKKWKQKNPDYEKNRYANDPEYRERRKAAQRERYAKNAELREQQKEYMKAWRKQNPEYNEQRKEYMRKWRAENPDYYKNWYRKKVEEKEVEEG